MAQPPEEEWVEGRTGKTCWKCGRPCRWQLSRSPRSAGNYFATCKNYDAARNIECKMFIWQHEDQQPPPGPPLATQAPVLPLTQPQPLNSLPKRCTHRNCDSSRPNMACARLMCAPHCKALGGCHVKSHGGVRAILAADEVMPPAPSQQRRLSPPSSQPARSLASARSPPAPAPGPSRVITVNDAQPNPRFASHITPLFTQLRANAEMERVAADKAVQDRLKWQRMAANSLNVIAWSSPSNPGSHTLQEGIILPSIHLSNELLIEVDLSTSEKPVSHVSVYSRQLGIWSRVRVGTVITLTQKDNNTLFLSSTSVTTHNGFVEFLSRTSPDSSTPSIQTIQQSRKHVRKEKEDRETAKAGIRDNKENAPVKGKDKGKGKRTRYSSDDNRSPESTQRAVPNIPKKQRRRKRTPPLFEAPHHFDDLCTRYTASPSPTREFEIKMEYVSPLRFPDPSSLGAPPECIIISDSDSPSTPTTPTPSSRSRQATRRSISQQARNATPGPSRSQSLFTVVSPSVGGNDASLVEEDNEEDNEDADKEADEDDDRHFSPSSSEEEVEKGDDPNDKEDPRYLEPGERKWPRDYYVCDIVQVLPRGLGSKGFQQVFPGVRFVSSNVSDARQRWHAAPQSTRDKYLALGRTPKGLWKKFMVFNKHPNHVKDATRKKVERSKTRPRSSTPSSQSRSPSPSTSESDD